MGLVIYVVAALVALLVTIATDVPAAFLFGPLLGIAILWLGLGSLRSLQAGAAHIPSEPPTPVDPVSERTTYWCGGCGTEVLLLVRGTDTPPRHCGERMHVRVETAHEPRASGR